MFCNSIVLQQNLKTEKVFKQIFFRIKRIFFDWQAVGRFYVNVYAFLFYRNSKIFDDLLVIIVQTVGNTQYCCQFAHNHSVFVRQGRVVAVRRFWKRFSVITHDIGNNSAVFFGVIIKILRTYYILRMFMMTSV